jgi:hypothetical protein
MKKLVALAFIFIALNCVSSSQDKAVLVLANSIDHDMAGDLYNTLSRHGYETVHVTAQGFAELNSSRYIIILGGHRSPEGVGDIVGGMLSGVEKKRLLSGPGAGFMFRRSDVWSAGQVVWILAGYGKEDTRLAHEVYASAVIGELDNLTVDVFENVLISSHSDGGNVTLYTNSVGFYVTVVNNGSTPVDAVSLKASRISGKPLAVSPQVFSLRVGESRRFLVEVGALDLRETDGVNLVVGSSNITLHVDVREAPKPPSGGCSMCRR